VFGASRGADAGFVNGEFGGDVGDLSADALFGCGVADVGEDVGDPGTELFHFGFAHAARGDGGSAEANAAAFHGRKRIEGNGIFVDGDAGAVESFFGVAAGDVAGVDFDEEKVIVGAAGNNAEAMLGDGNGESFGVGDDLLLVGLEAGFHRFFQADRFGGDGVNERTALDAGESEFVELFGECGFAEDEAAAGTAQSFVRRGGNEIGVGDGARMDAGGDEAGDVGHIDEEERADGFSGAGDALKINDAGIGAGTGDDHFGLMFFGEAFDFVVVDAFVFFADAVGDELVHAAGKIERVAVGQMAAVGEIHAEDDVVFLQRGHIDGDVGGSAGVGLHVGVFGAEEFFGAVDGELFDFVGVFAAAVVAFAGIAFGVLVGEDRAHGFEDGFRDEVFTGDEFEAGGFALRFFAEEFGDLRVNGFQRA